MTAQIAKEKTDKKYTFVLGARLPQRLSKEDRELLLRLKPSRKMQTLLSRIPPLKIVDGNTCGL
jgi:hypothetical protein